MTSPFIEFDHVSFGYDASRTILNDVSLRFARGQVTVIMGGSGSGKTTLLRLLGGLSTGYQGQIRVGGQVLDAADREQLYALRRRSGMLFQFGALFTDLDVFDNVAFPLREHAGLPESMVRDLVLMKLQAVGLRGAARLGISQLSGGMARRVALARAVALDPEIIMADEPFAGLDPISMGVTADLLRSLTHAIGATTLLVSHDVAKCFQIADYAYLLSSRGTVVAHGTPAQMLASTDPEVCQFIRGEPDGPVRFHFPAPSLADDLGVAA